MTTTAPITPADFDRAYDHIRANAQSNGFYASLLSQFESRGTLSEKQVLAVLNGIERDRQRNAERQQVNADPVTECGMYRTDEGVFRVRQSKNTGRLYAERFDPTASTKSERYEYAKGVIFRLTASDRLTVEQAEELGSTHGVCCVCGADLTDPKSVSRGIGPVCAKRV